MAVWLQSYGMLRVRQFGHGAIVIIFLWADQKRLQTLVPIFGAKSFGKA